VCVILGIGLLLRWQKPRIADRFTRWLRFITLFFIVYILTFGIYTNLYVFKVINYRTVIVSAILPYSGFLIGFLMSLITRQSRERSIAIFIESGRSRFVIIFCDLCLQNLIDEVTEMKKFLRHRGE
jgi:sodium/bile acid cotransporter 3/5